MIIQDDHIAVLVLCNRQSGYDDSPNLASIQSQSPAMNVITEKAYHGPQIALLGTGFLEDDLKNIPHLSLAQVSVLYGYLDT